MFYLKYIDPDGFALQVAAYSTLIGVLLIINGIIFAAWAQSARERKRQERDAPDKGPSTH